MTFASDVTHHAGPVFRQTRPGAEFLNESLRRLAKKSIGAKYFTLAVHVPGSAAQLIIITRIEPLHSLAMHYPRNISAFVDY